LGNGAVGACRNAGASVNEVRGTSLISVSPPFVPVEAKCLLGSGGQDYQLPEGEGKPGAVSLAAARWNDAPERLPQPLLGRSL